MNKNYYAVQIPPEMQEGRYYMEDYENLYFLDANQKIKLKKWTNKQEECLLRNCTYLDDCLECALNFIKAKTGNKWEISTLSGNTSNEWIDILYDSSLYNDEALKAISAYFFNTGTEWRIYEVPDHIKIKCVDDLDDYYVLCLYYCTGNNYIKELKKLAENDGAELKQVFKFMSYKKVPVYML